MARERRRVHYAGHVQGVGFRYTARRIAEGYAVGGYVRNLPDGGVELVAEGEAAEVESFLRDVYAALDDKIRSTAEAPLPLDPDGPPCTAFVIRH